MVTSKPGQKSEQSSAAWIDHSELASGWRVVRFLPIFEWLPRYGRDDIAGDLIAGAVVAIMLVPQSMAYAMLAGLPLQVGLYASILPLLLYALLGSSRVLAVGPVAMVSLITASGLAPLATAGAADYVNLALFLALLVGLLQVVMGIARLGFLVNFLSHPVISGFTSAAALVIGFGQAKHLLGIASTDPNVRIKCSWNSPADCRRRMSSFSGWALEVSAFSCSFNSASMICCSESESQSRWRSPWIRAVPWSPCSSQRFWSA
jgi:MFS superfamily sulfate permease-like transporter